MFPIIRSTARSKVSKSARDFFTQEHWAVSPPPSYDVEDFCAERGGLVFLVSSFDLENQRYISNSDILERMTRHIRIRQTNFQGAVLFVAESSLMGLSPSVVAERGIPFVPLAHLVSVNSLPEYVGDADFSTKKLSALEIAIFRGAEKFALRIVSHLEQRGELYEAISLCNILVTGSIKIRECHFRLVELYMRVDDKDGCHMVLNALGADMTNNKAVLECARKVAMKFGQQEEVKKLDNKLGALMVNRPSFSDIIENQKKRTGAISVNSSIVAADANASASFWKRLLVR